MSKNVLLLSASPRRGGNSDTLCDQFMSGAREAGHRTEKVFLRDKRINYCVACGTCYDGKVRCPQKDDMSEILQKLIDADVIVLATPVYFYTMNAQMKTLIDRTVSRYTEIKNKDSYFIVTAADSSVPAMERTIEGLRGFLSCLDDVEEKGIVYGTGTWGMGEIQGKPAMKEAFEAGKGV